jgi:hypothetical protein
MLRMRNHGVGDYAALPDIGTTDAGVLRDDDRACLDEIGQFLVMHDAWQRFAIWLLHKHFDPAPGEVFVERVVTSRRRIDTAPLATSAVGPGRLTMTALRFDDPVGAGVNVIGMEFADPADAGSPAPVVDDDEEALIGIAERLRAHDKTDRFGVRLIHDPLGVSERELLLETADAAHRTVHFDIAGRDAIRPGDTVVETTWQWQPVESRRRREGPHLI